MKTIFAILTLALTGCVTRIEGRVVNVTVSPTTNLRAQGLPLPSL